MKNFFARNPKEKIKITTTKPEIPREEIVKPRLFDNTSFSDKQKEVLYEAMDKNLPYQLIADIDYSAEKMRILLKSMEEDVEIYRYINPSKFNEKQLEIIYDALKNGIDISTFADEYIPAPKMQTIKIGLELNVNLSSYVNYPEDILYEIGLFLKEKLCIDDYLYGDYNAEQLRQIRLGLLSGVDASIYTSNEYSAEHMQLIREVLEEGGEVEPIADPSLDLNAVRTYKSHYKGG